MSYSVTDTFQNALRYEGQNYRFVPTYLRGRDPIAPQSASPDIRPAEQQGYYIVNSLWTNTTNGNVWLLVGIANNLGNWVLISSQGSAGIQFITPPAGTVVTPVAGGVTFNSSNGTINIVGNGNDVDFDALPVLDFLQFDVPNGPNFTVQPSNGIVKFRSADGTVTISGTQLDEIDLSVPGAGNAFQSLKAGGDGDTVLPDPMNHWINLVSANSSVTINGDPVTYTVDFDAVPALSKLQIDVPHEDDPSFNPVVPTQSLGHGVLVFSEAGGITITAIDTDSILFDTSNAVNNLVIRAEVGPTDVSPDAATHRIDFTSPDNSISITGNAVAHRVSFSALPVLTNILKIRIPGAIDVSPNGAGRFEFTQSGGMTITNPMPNVINFNSTGSAGTVTQFTADDLNTALPAAGNINVFKTVNFQASTTASGSTIRINAPNCALLIVDPVANYGTHQTIQAAINAAVVLGGNRTIVIRPGIYIENLTLRAGVNLAAWTGDELTPNVTIKGRCTFTDAGIVSISNIRLETNLSQFLVVSGANASQVYLTDCFLNCTNSFGINFTNSNAQSFIGIESSEADIAAPGISLYTKSGPGELSIYYSFVGDSGVSTTSSTASAGVVSYKHCDLRFPTTTSGTCIIVSEYNSYRLFELNTTAIIHGGSAVSRLIYDLIETATATPIHVTTNLYVEFCILSSVNAVAISGGGSVAIAYVQYPGNATNPTISPTQIIIPTSTTIEGSWTPTFSSTSLNITYTARKGRYVRIGNTVFIFGFILVNTVTNGGSGTLSITGLPYTSANVANQFASFSVSPCTFAMGGTISQVGFVNAPNTSTLVLYAQTASTGVTTNAHTILPNETVGFSGCYSVV